ncbi:Macrolide export ATP-binding/permease protein MacB [Grimontia celer]|uniref:Macrolide export ATP-binding/permease protein MacB n=1 Tax=Grimontia celer TaxID=1796497 RepID=A0A128F8B1_9GAMM|nr:ABC transporter permease [Grimontia celer]CZF83012.1 Macrolide export ATP-binding/permease protein MacB [Grimontia celer]
MKELRILPDLFREARLAMLANWGRSMLSMIGIAVGIAAVMTVDTVSTGGKAFVMQELETFGLKSVWVYRANSSKDPHRRTRTGTGITNKDLVALQGDCCPSVSLISPIVSPSGSAPIVQAGNRYSNAHVTGVNMNYLTINNDQLRVGRGLREVEIRNRRPVAMIGETVASDLYPGISDPLGRTLRISGREYQVIGVLRSKSRDLLASIGSAGGDVNNRILVSYPLIQALNGNDDVSYIQAQATTVESAEAAATQLKGVLSRRYQGVFEYESGTLASYIKTTDNILGGVTIIGIIAASSALIVGAIGVGGIMSTAVAERTREIGIRAAIGAHRSHIMIQFIVESVLICLIGGLAGLAVGMLIGVVLDFFTGFPLFPGILGVSIALVVSILVGLVAGYLPARRAAQMKPVDALRDS